MMKHSYSDDKTQLQGRRNGVVAAKGRRSASREEAAECCLSDYLESVFAKKKTVFMAFFNVLLVIS